MKRIVLLLLTPGLLFVGDARAGNDLTIAAAASLRLAFEEMVAQYRLQHPEAAIELVFGSSGRLSTQILNGAPFDLFYAADVTFPARVHREGFAATQPKTYAVGRIAMWSRTFNASAMTLQDLTQSSIRRIAIAQPTHAPYGQRAREALQAAGIWNEIQAKLVFGENIAQAAQMAESQAADVGIVSLALVVAPPLARYGYLLIDDNLHEPLEHAYVVTGRGRDNRLAYDFAEFVDSMTGREILERHGFTVPENEGERRDAAVSNARLIYGHD